MEGKLPEEFAPTGPKLSKFPIRPAPPIRSHLFADEARFALRLSVLAGATEFAAWAWLSAAVLSGRELLLLAGLRLLRPLWAKLGARIPRPLVASVLIGAAMACGSPFLFFPLAVAGVGLPALGDLCASTIGDRVTVERRATAYAWLDMAQALGGAAGFAFGQSGWVWLAAFASLLLGTVGISELSDRGTPRSSWPLRAYLSTARTPLGAQLTVLAMVGGLLSRPADRGLMQFILPVAGMVAAARIEPRMPNAIWLARAAVLLAVGGLLLPPLRPFAMGMMFAAIPAAVARGAGEMERPLASALAWSALFAGAAVGSML